LKLQKGLSIYRSYGRKDSKLWKRCKTMRKRKKRNSIGILNHSKIRWMLSHANKPKNKPTSSKFSVSLIQQVNKF